jgi:hypothetical protein
MYRSAPNALLISFVLRLQYEIPVLHLAETSNFDSLAGRKTELLKGGRVMKNRIDKSKLESLVRQWTAKLNSNKE